MPQYFWEHALEYMMYVHNRLPNSSLNFKTPFQMLTGNLPKFKHIRRFGCAASVFIPGRKQKFETTGKLAFLIGVYDTGYKLFNPKSKLIIRSKHVSFIESKVYGDFAGEFKRLSIDTELKVDDLITCNCSTNDLTSNNRSENEQDTRIGTTGTGNQLDITERDDISNDRIVRERHSVEKEPETDDYEITTYEETIEDDANVKVDNVDDDEYELISCEEIDTSDGQALFFKSKHDKIYEPETYRQAINCKDSNLWKESIHD